ncbi:MAG: DNA-protecting protein DprA [Candidatus Omnitrophica bacterium CG07_land_8_20_14_0_80_42_15]|uniref:DNA-protecting protein DprA n=1 Tax=Candidatus Aquitaenariimonas noxiae TaxID=1974741 RepID=A0A2J0L5G3_9BACT|nr:MAG: DNA-protecting protein DprA [Candidatus Omnitrophica bacterium CG07_land_8_20_14_0_80_42_15]
MKIISIKRSDPKYPKNLRDTYDPPEVLYVNGELLPQDEAAVALVGTRRPTYYGMQACEKLSYDLALYGITIVSGMARGIDTAAHRGALKAGGRTIAVLGSGHDNIYPKENKKLYEEITKSGAVVSEFPDDTPPYKWNFPQRNRVISGLSLGVVVIEAPKKSGALITVDFALEQGREVFAMPGKVNSLASEGTHQLIKDGAKLVENANDIIEELEIKLKKFLKENKTKENNLLLDEKEEEICRFLTDEPKHIDEIALESKIPVNKVLSVLTQLVIKRVVKELPGKKFIAPTRR